jgi:hypothetical protein
MNWSVSASVFPTRISDIPQVDRHIRLIDQAIKEHETSISIGIRPGTHPAPIVLPDIQVPRWGRPARAVHSLSGEEGSEEGQGDVHVPFLGIATLNATDIASGRRNVKRGKAKAARKKSAEIILPQDHTGPGVEIGTRRTTRSLRLNNPSAPATAAPDEKRYCYCKQSTDETASPSFYLLSVPCRRRLSI